MNIKEKLYRLADSKYYEVAMIFIIVVVAPVVLTLIFILTDC